MLGGQYQRLVLHLVREAAGADATPSASKSPGSEGTVVATTAAAPTSTSPVGGSGAPSGDPSGARLVVKWSAAGVAVVGLALGVAEAIVHSERVSDFDKLGCYDDNGKGVNKMDMPTGACQSALQAYQGPNTWSIVGFVGAGAFAATWLILQLTESSRAPTADRQALAPTFCAPSSSSWGLSCEARF